MPTLSNSSASTATSTAPTLSGALPPWPPEPGKAPLRVAMLLNNPCTNDSRVIKEAETLALAGHEVCVFCSSRPDVPRVEWRQGVLYRRVEVPSAKPLRATKIMLMHWVMDHLGLGRLPRKGAVRRPLTRPGSLLHKLGRGLLVLLLVPVLLVIALFAGGKRRRRAGSGRGKAAPLAAARSASSRGLLSLHRLVNFGLRVVRGCWRRARRLALAAVGRVPYVNDWLRTSLRPAWVYNLFRHAMIVPVSQWHPDVVHAHDLIALPAGAEIARQTGARLVYDAHEFATLEVENEPRWARRYKEVTERTLIRKVDGMITVSAGFSREFARRYRIEPPVVIYNTPPFQPHNTIGRDVRSDLGFDASVPLGVYIGGLNPRRALTQLVESLVHAPEMHIVKVGGRNPRYEQMILDAAHRFGVQDRFHLLDGVPPDQIIHYVRTGDFGIVTRIKFSLQQDYSMPNKLFESVFGGLPIVVGDVREIREFLAEFPVGVLMNSLDPKDIARAMREVYARREELRPTPAMREAMMVEFGWPAQARKLVALYDRLAAGSVPVSRADGAAAAATKERS